ncbi:MAG: DMT family transporter [Desulfobacterales bacterium]
MYRVMFSSTAFLAAGFVLLWNSGFIGAEYGLPFTGPFTLLFWRYWALTCALLVYLALRGRLRWPGFYDASAALVVGVLAHGVWLGCVLFSLQQGVPAGIVALVVALQPMLTGALSGPLVGEHTPLARWFGLFVGFCGVVIAVGARTSPSDAGSVFGYVIPFGSVVGITLASLLQRYIEVHGRAHRLPVDISLFYQSLATALAATIPAIALEGLATRWEPVFMSAMLWLILGVSLAAYALMWLLLSRLDATRVASLFYLGPPVTMIMAWVAFSDTLQPADVIGLIIVAAGVVVVQRQ